MRDNVAHAHTTSQGGDGDRSTSDSIVNVNIWFVIPISCLLLLINIITAKPGQEADRPRKSRAPPPAARVPT